MLKFLAQDPFGKVVAPPQVAALVGKGGLSALVGAILKTLIIGAGVYALFNFVLAGYDYISSSGDPKGIQAATSRITQSIIGLVVAAGAFLIAGLVGQIVFGNPNYILQIQIFKP